MGHRAAVHAAERRGAVLPNDHLGTSQQLVDGLGQVVWSAKYEAFGAASVSAHAEVVNNLSFPGQYYDEETGTHYNYHRDYEPGLVRYIESDPIGLNGGMNDDAYALQNPLKYGDNEGLSSGKCCDAQVPDGTEKLVVLTCYAEASNDCADGDKEARAITDTIYNRIASNQSYWVVAP